MPIRSALAAPLKAAKPYSYNIQVMLATNHAFAGTIIGSVLPLPEAVPAAFASHFVLDVIPHYGIRRSKRNKNTTYRLVVFSDTVIALCFAAAAIYLHKWAIALCGFVAWSPDLLWVIYYVKEGFNLNIKPRNRFMKFHLSIQHERPWGMIVELVAAAILVPAGLTYILR